MIPKDPSGTVSILHFFIFISLFEFQLISVKIVFVQNLHHGLSFSLQSIDLFFNFLIDLVLPYSDLLSCSSNELSFLLLFITISDQSSLTVHLQVPGNKQQGSI